jgi:hypothetical protein
VLVAESVANAAEHIYWVAMEVWNHDLVSEILQLDFSTQIPTSLRCYEPVHVATQVGIAVAVS